MRPLPRNEASILSPLRYPGAKRRLYGYIAETIRLNGLSPRLFVEPFAGGASISLQLLNDGLVEGVALGDKDPLIASFWKVALFDHKWLIESFANMSVTLDQWEKLRKDPGRTVRDRALACLFLNRTSFSGIIAPGAGPIGGRRQQSAYKIDCRFAIETISHRIRQVASLRDRIEFVHLASWERTLEKARALGYKQDEVAYYFDPPFYNKAERLYTHYFGIADHQRLHDALVDLRSSWILSYDPSPEIIGMYSDNGRRRNVELLYSIRRTNGLAEAQELIVTNLKRLPARTRLWRTSSEWMNR